MIQTQHPVPVDQSLNQPNCSLAGCCRNQRQRSTRSMLPQVAPLVRPYEARSRMSGRIPKHVRDNYLCQTQCTVHLTHTFVSNLDVKSLGKLIENTHMLHEDAERADQAA